MGLNLQELQKVVKKVIKEEKNVNNFRKEIFRVFGPTILTSRSINEMAKSVNDHLDIIEMKGLDVNSFQPSLLLKFINSDSQEVRKLVARLLPENFLNLMSNDSAYEVRYAVARRAPTSLIKEMIRQFPKDDYLRNIEKVKSLNESGLPTPKVDDELFDMYGESPLGKAYDDIEDLELTDSWYNTIALKIVNTYGRNVEEQWEESTVHRYVDSMASMGVEVDRQKLLDAVYELLSNREDDALQEVFFTSLVKKLRLDETEIMPIISEAQDQVDELLSSHISNSDYIKRFEKIFAVEYAVSKNPASVLFEGLSKVNHPSTATLNSSFIRDIDEKATDKYIAAWNSKNIMKGETHYRLSWSPNLSDNTINFHLELK